MGRSSDVMKNISRTQAAKSGKRKPWFRGKYAAAAPKAIAKEEAQPKYYSTEDKKVKLTNSRCNSNATKLKASLVPGAVVIPLRRVPQSYVIGTSTVVDASGVDTSSVSDSLFKKPKSTKKKADGPFEDKEEKKPLDEAFKALQEKVDASLNKALAGDDTLKSYIKSKFSLSRADYPHEMSF